MKPIAAMPIRFLSDDCFYIKKVTFSVLAVNNLCFLLWAFCSIPRPDYALLFTLAYMHL